MDQSPIALRVEAQDGRTHALSELIQRKPLTALTPANEFMNQLTRPLALALCASCIITAAIAEPAAEKELAALSTATEAKNFDEALAIARSIAKQDPLPPGLEDAFYKAAQLGVDQMKLEPAAGFYRLLLDKFPQSGHAADARAELVGCYNFLRQLDQCIAQAEHNLKADPDSKWVEYWKFLIAQSHFKQWKFAQAKTKLDAFLAEYPDGDYASHARNCLGKIDPAWEIDADGLVSYSGKYDGDIRFAAAMKALPSHKEAGFEMLEERLGIDLRPHSNVIYHFVDAGNKTKSGLKASTYVVGRDNQPSVVVRFYTEYVVVQPAGFRQTIIHELKHAGFKGIMGQAYENLPEWIKEGLAVWGSDDVETRLQLVLSNKIGAAKDPMGVLDGIDDGDHDDADYMEDALAFEWLESKKAGNVKAFCRDLIEGKPYREIWAELSGMDYQAALAEANAHCRKRVETALGQAYADFVPMRQAHEAALNAGQAATTQWLEGGGKKAFETWVDANPDHPAEPLARFCLARSLARQGQGAEARKLFEQILANDALRCTLLDDAQFWIGVSYNWETDFANAKSAFGVLLRDFSASSSAKQVFGKFPAAGPVTE